MSIYFYSKKGRGNQATFTDNIKKNGHYLNSVFFPFIVRFERYYDNIVKTGFSSDIQLKPLYKSTVKIKVEARYSNY